MLTTADNIRIPPVPPNVDPDELDESLLVENDDAKGWVFAETMNYSPSSRPNGSKKRRTRSR